METIAPVQSAPQTATPDADPYSWQASNIPGTGPAPGAQATGQAAGEAAADALAGVQKSDVLLTAVAVGIVCFAVAALVRRTH